MARYRGYGAARALVHLALLFFGLAGAPAIAAGPLIWAFGDSLTAGYGLAPADGFTSQLERALRRSGVAATVRNGGISGDTAAQGRARLLWGLRGLGARPDLVIVELGANDMLRGLPPAQAARNLDLIMATLAQRAQSVPKALEAKADALLPRLDALEASGGAAFEGLANVVADAEEGVAAAEAAMRLLTNGAPLSASSGSQKGG